ncbi:MAG: hypothetical protein IJI67_09575 [Clostridia bacterium]|nr:hypothetical protein [Clostridia bacterium]
MMKKIVISVLSVVLALCLLGGNVSAFADGWDTPPVCLVHTYSQVFVEPAGLQSDGYTARQCKICQSIDNSSKQRIAGIASVELEQEEYLYDGNAKTPAVLVKDVDGETIAAQNYTVEYFNHIAAGSDAYARITFSGNYTGSVERLFRIKNTGAICGQIDTNQFYHPVMVDLYLGDTMVIGTAILNDGTFFLDDLAPGTYSAKVRSVNSPTIEITDIAVANNVINLNESENAQLQTFCLAVGDINGDGVVGFPDASQLLANNIYGSDRYNDWYEERIDLNFDGIINVQDIGILLQAENYGACQKVLQY